MYVTSRHEQDCLLIENEQDRMGWNGMRNDTNKMGFVLNIPLITAHEYQTLISDAIQNNHE